MLEADRNYYDGVPVRMDARVWEYHDRRQKGMKWGFAYWTGDLGRYGGEYFKVLWNNGQVSKEKGSILVINKDVIRKQKMMIRREKLKKIKERRRNGISR